MKVTNVEELLQLFKDPTAKFYAGWLQDAVAALEEVVRPGLEPHYLPKLKPDGAVPKPGEYNPFNPDFIDGFKLGHLSARRRNEYERRAQGPAEGSIE